MVKDWLVVDRFMQNLVVLKSIVGNWLDRNVSNLWLMSVLRNLDVAFMGGLGGVDWLVSLIIVVRLLVRVIALSAVLVRCDFWLNIVVSIILSFSASLDRDNGGDNKIKSVH